LHELARSQLQRLADRVCRKAVLELEQRDIRLAIAPQAIEHLTRGAPRRRAIRPLDGRPAREISARDELHPRATSAFAHDKTRRGKFVESPDGRNPRDAVNPFEVPLTRDVEAERILPIEDLGAQDQVDLVIQRGPVAVPVAEIRPFPGSIGIHGSIISDGGAVVQFPLSLYRECRPIDAQTIADSVTWRLGGGCPLQTQLARWCPSADANPGRDASDC
jgi:hypothetical protein